MVQIAKILILFCICSFNLKGQSDNNLAWIKELADEVQNETDLCERCTWVVPAISEVIFNNQLFYFLRFGCSTSESVARLYTPEGVYLGECKSNDDDFVCNPSDVDAFITYTFASSITILWSCETGFDCDFALENNINREVPIFVDDSRCVEGIKTLQVSDKFVSYQWSGSGLTGTAPILKIEQGGNYKITVTDEKDCTFFGEIDVPDITKLSVNIKGPNQVCIGETVEFKTSNFQSYKWSTGATDDLIIISETGDYSVTVTNEQDCEGVADFTLQNYEPLAISIIADKTKVTEGNPVKVAVSNASVTQPIIAYEWSSNNPIDCTTCPETTFFPKNDNEIQVAVLDENGCFTIANFSIELEPLPVEIYAPNIFKPNSIGSNEKFTLFGGTNIERIESLNIFDRWGNLIFSKNNFLPNQLSEGWDGKTNGNLAKQDVYLFQAVVLFINGETKKIGGDVLLIR